MVYKQIRRLSFRLFPPQCLMCLEPGQPYRDLCAACEAELPWLRTRCNRCALPIASGHLCGDCVRRPPRFDHCHAAWEYGPPIDRLITGFKHQHRRDFGQLLAECSTPLFTHAPTPDALLPVPLHWRRLLQRGFNQAEFLARHIGQSLMIPVLNRSRRDRAKRAQQFSTLRQRFDNVSGAFNPDPRCPQYRHIAIVDDVLTTGATANSLARSLRAAGVESISVWCLARTPKPG